MRQPYCQGAARQVRELEADGTAAAINRTGSDLGSYARRPFSFRRLVTSPRRPSSFPDAPGRILIVEIPLDIL